MIMSDSLASLTRRQFVLTAAAAVVIRPRSLVLPSEVEIVEFSASGQKLRTVRVPKIVKSDAEWRKQLTYEQYLVPVEGQSDVLVMGGGSNSRLSSSRSRDKREPSARSRGRIGISTTRDCFGACAVTPRFSARR